MDVVQLKYYGDAYPSRTSADEDFPVDVIGKTDPVKVDDILPYQDGLFDYFDANHKDLLDEIANTGKLPETEKLDAAIKEYAATFQASEK